jgi:hypothetical protein
MAKDRIDPQELKDIAKVNVKAADFNDQLKESLASLSAMAKSYDKILAKIDSMNKGQLNTNKIQREMEAATAKHKVANDIFTEAERVASAQQVQAAKDYKDALKEVAKQITAVQQTTLTGNVAQQVAMQAQLNTANTALDVAKKGLDAESIRLLALEETRDISAELVQQTQYRLMTEKELEKTLGKSGMVLGFMSKRLGIFKDTYAQIVESARDGNTKWLTSINILGGFSLAIVGIYKLLKGPVLATIGSIKSGIATLVPEGDKNPLTGMTSALSGMLKTIPFVGGFLGGLVDIFSSILGSILGIDNLIVKSGRSLNLNTNEARALYKEYAKISAKNGDIFLTSQKYLQSQVELGQALGVNNRLSESTLATNIKLKDIAGLDAELRSQIAENAIVSGKESEDLVKSVFAQVSGLKSATGISLNYQKVLGEANKLGGYLGLSFAKYPDKIAKALVTTKALGTSLKEMDSIADSFLDFESSISSEFEAQLLTGKDINLQDARRAFLNNDLATAAMEINKQVGSSAEYLSINRIAADSMAKSFGMSRDQLGDMLRKQELLSKLGATDKNNAREQLQIGLARYQTQSALSAAIGKEAYDNLVNASTQEKIAAFIDKIKTSLMDFIESSGLIEKIQGFVDYLTNPANVSKMLTSVKGIVATALDVLGSLAEFIMRGVHFFSAGFIGPTFKEIGNMGTGIHEAANRVRAFDTTAEAVGPSALRNQVGAPASATGTGTAAAGQTGGQPVNVNVLVQNSYDGEKAAPINAKHQQYAITDNKSGNLGMGHNTSNSGQ